MKLYDCSTAPSPRRVRMFLSEKRISVQTVEVDLGKGEHLTPAFQGVNPWCTVPVLELDDGTRIAETTAIWRFLEELCPEPPLMGIDAKDKAIVTMWERRMEFDGFLPVAEVLRNTSPRLKGRALTGKANCDQIPALAKRGHVRVQRFFTVLEEQLAGNEFIAGPRYTIADITAQCAVDFAAWIKHSIPDDHENAKRWHEAVSVRPSAKV